MKNGHHDYLIDWSTVSLAWPWCTVLNQIVSQPHFTTTFARPSLYLAPQMGSVSLERPDKGDYCPQQHGSQGRKATRVPSNMIMWQSTEGCGRCTQRPRRRGFMLPQRLILIAKWMEGWILILKLEIYISKKKRTLKKVHSVDRDDCRALFLHPEKITFWKGIFVKQYLRC